MGSNGRGIRSWFAAALLLASGAPARADDSKEARPLELRIFDVGALTRGAPDYVPIAGPFGYTPSQANDQANPIYGGEAEEVRRPFGTIEDLIERVKADSEPGAWEREGVSIAAQGTGRLVVRAGKATLDAVSERLARLEQDALACVTVDVLAVRGDPAAAAGEGGFAGAVTRGALRVEGAARASAVSGQRVTAFSGSVRAYVADQDVEVAQEAATTDPQVAVQPEGLCVDVTPRVVDGGLSLDLRAWLARVDGADTRSTAEGDSFEALRVEGRRASAALLRPKSGEWTLLPSSGGTAFAVRATLRVAPAAAAGPASLPYVSAGKEGPLVSRSWSIADLSQPFPNTRGRPAGLEPSHYVAPEPPEMAEPSSAFPVDMLVEFVKIATDPAGWTREGASLEIRNSTLYARATEAQARGIDTLLAAFRRGVREIRARATAVSLPLASLPELAAGLDDGADFLKEGGAALLARPGARVEDAAAVRVAAGSRGATVVGLLHRYVGDYDPVIAQKATIGNPVVYSALAGISLDVQADLCAGGAAVRLEVRYDRSTWRAQRAWKTRHGDVDLPDLGIQRVRGSCVVPLGSTRLLSTAVEGDRVVLVLLTANEG